MSLDGREGGREGGEGGKDEGGMEGREGGRKGRGWREVGRGREGRGDCYTYSNIIQYTFVRFAIYGSVDDVLTST